VSRDEQEKGKRYAEIKSDLDAIYPDHFLYFALVFLRVDQRPLGLFSGNLLAFSPPFE